MYVCTCISTLSCRVYLRGEVEEDGPAVGEEIEVLGLVQVVHQHAEDAEDDEAVYVCVCEGFTYI